jgi:hypothetical protein
MHVYTFFAPYSLSYPLSPPPLPSHWFQPSSLGRTCSDLLFFDFAEKRKDKKKHKELFSFEIKVDTQGFSL